VHLQIEAMKVAFADVYRYVSDPVTMTVRNTELLDPAYLAGRAKLIDLARAQNFNHGTPGKGGTIYLTAADASGMMVSFIQSNYMGFGSGVVVPGTGVSLQNRAHTFTLQAGHPNQAGGSKRPFQTIIPGFVTKDGQPVMSFGVMGGSMQPQGHAQVMVRLADYGQNPQACCDGPRYRVVEGLRVNVEPGFPKETLGELERRGHQLEELAQGYLDFGSAQLIYKLEDGFLGASDPRRDGQAVGF
jgi:gamma-glutamyltranspeptidase/glutathione hydrolase